ncbi:hypothetical protein BJX64DRAFT_288599 [Aspergillus heterothallicus]
MPRLANAKTKRTAARIVSILDEAQIPNFLFGWTAVSLYGYDREIPEIDFVVPDNMVKQAAHAVVRAGNLICADPTCKDVKQDRFDPNLDATYPYRRDRFHPVPERHFHLVSGDLLSFHRKSDIAWEIPDLQAGPPAANDPHIVLSTNGAVIPQRIEDGASGPWYQLYPVKVLNADTFTDVVILLSCRDFDVPSAFDTLWRYYLIDVQDHKGCEKKIRPEFQEV